MCHCVISFAHPMSWRTPLPDPKPWRSHSRVGMTSCKPACCASEDTDIVVLQQTAAGEVRIPHEFHSTEAKKDATMPDEKRQEELNFFGFKENAEGPKEIDGRSCIGTCGGLDLGDSIHEQRVKAFYEKERERNQERIVVSKQKWGPRWPMVHQGYARDQGEKRESLRLKPWRSVTKSLDEAEASMEKGFKVTIDASSGDALGVRFIANGPDLRVAEVLPTGLVKLWNQTKARAEQVEEGDFITSVNDQKKHPVLMLRELKEHKVLRFRIRKEGAQMAVEF